MFDRGEVQPIPEGVTPQANFSPDISELEQNPCRLYAKYQITVSADATASDIYTLLPDTLPVQVDFTYGSHGSNIYATGTVDCPVTWKPLSLPSLSAGESITISDAAEDIWVPGGTPVSTPLGIFQLDEPLRLYSDPYSTGKVRLLLNVSTEGENPTGVLREGLGGLEIALNKKPTGAVSIQAYILAGGETTWTELSGLSLLEDFNQPSTANSGYALVLRNDQEPYRSYLEAAAAGTSSAPFFVALKIKGGIYDAKQLVLSWPDIYEDLPELPEVGGSGGNEGNAGADNKDDSTEGGQRPTLPQAPDNTTNTQQPNPAPDDSRGEPQTPTDSADSRDEPPSLDSNDTGQAPQTPADSDDSRDEPQTIMGFADNHSEPPPSPDSNDTGQTQQANPPHTPGTAFTVPMFSTLSGLSAAPAHLSPDSTDTSATDNNDSRIPFLPAAAVAAALGCIGAAVCKTSGYRLFYRIAGKIRKITKND